MRAVADTERYRVHVERFVFERKFFSIVWLISLMTILGLCSAGWFGYLLANESNILNAISPVPPAMSRTFIRGRMLSSLTNLDFHRRCTPALIASFMRSYDVATFSNTSYT